MRIISKFKDYYDSVLASGRDDAVVYVRQPKFYTNVPSKFEEVTTLPEKEWDEVYRKVWKWMPHISVNGSSVVRGCIYFCGKRYPFYVSDELFSWNKKFHDLPNIKNSRSMRYGGDYRKFLDAETGGDCVSVNVHFNSPLVVSMDSTVLPQFKYHPTFDIIAVNPPLYLFDFQKVLDPFSAFQELSMFVGGVLSNSSDPVSPLTDKENVLRHGFDPKYGFRKMPERKPQ